MSETPLDFQTLVASAKFDSWCTTFAYWLGVLTDPRSEFVGDARNACSFMAGHYDREEQACEVRDLESAPYVPDVFRPVAPVTLALRWSPFPAAAVALGEPVQLGTGGAGSVVAIFRPVGRPAFPAETPDERHLLFLLGHCCQRARAAKRWVTLVGCPGWAYDSEDFIAKDRAVRQIMKKFGFVFCGRKPRRA